MTITLNALHGKKGGVTHTYAEFGEWLALELDAAKRIYANKYEDEEFLTVPILLESLLLDAECDNVTVERFEFILNCQCRRFADEIARDFIHDIVPSDQTKDVYRTALSVRAKFLQTKNCVEAQN